MAHTLINTLRRTAAPVLAAICLASCSSPPPKATATATTKPPPVLLIAQVDRGVQIVLPSVVLFEVGRSDLDARLAGPYLDRVAGLLITKTAKAVSVEGHTDSDGSAALNDSLAKARAAALSAALQARGVAAARISTAGFSFNRPVASNATEDGKRLNRRVEVVVLEEKVENITAGEPAGSFESALARVKDLMDRGLIKPAGSTL